MPANVSAASAPAPHGLRDVRKKMRQSMGTTVTATIKLAAKAKVLVHASGVKSR